MKRTKHKLSRRQRTEQKTRAFRAQSSSVDLGYDRETCKRSRSCYVSLKLVKLTHRRRARRQPIGASEVVAAGLSAFRFPHYYKILVIRKPSAYLGTDVKPGPVLRDPRLPLLGLRLGVVRLDERGDSEAPKHRDGKHGSHPLRREGKRAGNTRQYELNGESIKTANLEGLRS